MRGQPKHLLGIARHRRQRGVLPQIFDIGRDKHGRLALDLNARIAHQLHFANARDRPQLLHPSFLENENRAA